jgi:hypothetical protein
MEDGAKWASFILGVVLLALAGVSLLRDWLGGEALSLALPVVLGALGTLAVAIGLSRGPIDPRRARTGDDKG